MMRKLTYGIAVAALLLPGLFSKDLLADSLSSNWVVNKYSKSRLFVGDYDKESKILHLGWHVSLQSGWKTYWRSPGEAGLPPRWTWKNIENIHGITVNWPKPEFMRIFDMDTYIYHDEVILPIEVKITDEQKVTSLALGLEYMICEEICVPQEGSYRLDISSLENIKILPFQKAQLDRYRELVPLKKSSDNVRVKLDGDQGNMVMIKLSEDFINVSHIIVEGPDSILFEQAFTNDNGYFQVRYRGKRSALEGQEITLTLLLKGGGAHEMTVTVQR